MNEPASIIFERSTIVKAAEVLSRGGVAILPTDTIYGLHCSISRLKAIERIHRLKKRDISRGLVLLAADLRMAETLVEFWPGKSWEILSLLWPAPLTAILPARRGLPEIIAPRRAVALRIPAFDLLRSLISLLGEPLVSTSANLSGKLPLNRISEIKTLFPGLDAYFSRRGRAAISPSTIVDFRQVPPALVRPGRAKWPPSESFG